MRGLALTEQLDPSGFTAEGLEEIQAEKVHHQQDYDIDLRCCSEQVAGKEGEIEAKDRKEKGVGEEQLD